ncbi:holo-ACP synthase [Sphingobacterium endophyticum]|uniref:holo-ACP synthase n=1 Tax=Sphingobacterium endophyticum TaxID=2546448 RepID=UPI0012E226D9|nr:holo-ACP synthase [Sphingobacterium endophyticum]
MIISIGCDIVEHDVSKKLNWESDELILARIFSERELKLCSTKKTLQFLSGRFAAKEAILKCLFTGMEDGISLTEIEILKDDRGKPIIVLSGMPLKISNLLGIQNWIVSISHSSSFSQAFIIAEG